MTSTIRGVPSEVALGQDDGLRQSCVANLHNVMTVSQQGLGRRLAQLSPQRMRDVCAALNFALGCDR
jgi:mRNA interferase MazF